ncbi:hypothetical protein ACTQWG_09560 [Blautia sp. HCP3S3_H10_1]|uniref:hypothetical protein n=1 Tax=unclassified Blautia TaxID=2648079 RepID=UPI003F911AE7
MYTIQKLGDVYSSQPSLELSEELPSGTTIIMQTNGAYWYNNHPSGTTIQLSDFNKMGVAGSFSYNYGKNQEYRFVFDFSKAASGISSDSLNVTLAYMHKDTESTDSVKASVAIKMEAKGIFGLRGTAENLQITAPNNNGGCRWNRKNLILKVSAASDTQFPADAKLIIKESDKTYTYRKNNNDIFVVPLGWEQSDIVSLSLESELASQRGKTYPVEVKLCVGDAVETVSDLPQAAEYETEAVINDLSLKIADTPTPSLKIAGTQKILKITDKLKLTITMKDIPSDSTVHATIQQKGVNGYSGNFLDASVMQGDNEFSLGGITAAGSYQLLITVTKNNQKLLTVPYYFIVQDK